MAQNTSTPQRAMPAERDMLDIIFANKNKAYGAYELRRSYTKYLAQALGIGLALIVLSYFLPRLLGAVSGLMETKKPVEMEVTMGPPPDINPNEPPPPPPPPPPTPPPPTRSTVQFVPPVVARDEEVQEEPEKKTIEELEKTDKEVGKDDKEGNDDAPPETFSNPEIDKPVEVARVEPDKVYETFDLQKMPSFPGGDAELQKYLAANIKYPAIARENGIQGTVVLQFVVEKNGNISGVTVVKEPGGGGLAKEAIRVVESMPRWSPGEANGNAVKVKFTLPVRFRLE